MFSLKTHAHLRVEIGHSGSLDVLLSKNFHFNWSWWELCWEIFQEVWQIARFSVDNSHHIMGSLKNKVIIVISLFNLNITAPTFTLLHIPGLYNYCNMQQRSHAWAPNIVLEYLQNDKIKRALRSATLFTQKQLNQISSVPGMSPRWRPVWQTHRQISVSVPWRDRRAEMCRHGPPGPLRLAGSRCECMRQTPGQPSRDSCPVVVVWSERAVGLWWTMTERYVQS